MSKQCNKRRLIGDDEIHAAALWRLADWSPEEIEAASAPLAGLVQMCPALDSNYRSVRAMLPRLQRPGDRRDPWTALCALVCLWADAHDDRALFYLGGFEVLASYRQATRGRKKPAPDALDELMTSYLRLHPETTAMQLFEHCKSLAPVRMIVEGATGACLTYRVSPTSSMLKDVKWGAFKVRVSRIRKSLRNMREILPASASRRATENTFHWPNLAQPVVVTAAA